MKVMHKGLFFIAALAFLNQCQTANPRFAQKELGRNPLLSSSEESIPVRCANEAQKKQIDVPGLPGSKTFQFSPACGRSQLLNTNASASGKPLNLMIVIDLTKSMQPSIDGIKNGIIAFADELNQDNWNIHFGAIGYRDSGEILKIPFTDVNGLRREMFTPPWQAAGGRDIQEAGQEAILEGVKDLIDFHHHLKQAGNAANALLFVSNGPSYRFNNPTDFTTDDLAQSVRKKIASVEDFRFYHSAAIEFLPEGETNTIGAPTPRAQMRAFATQIKAHASEVPFPLTAQTLSQFADEFKSQELKNRLYCYIRSVELKSNGNEQIPSVDRKVNIYPEVRRGQDFSFKHSKDPIAMSYQFTIERCCRLNPKDEGCDQSRVTTVPVKYHQTGP